MNLFSAESHRSLLYVLFCAFEPALVFSLFALVVLDPRAHPVESDAFAVIFCFSFLSVLIVSAVMRRIVPRLAVVGFLSLLIGFLVVGLLPAIL